MTALIVNKPFQPMRGQNYWLVESEYVQLHRFISWKPGNHCSYVGRPARRAATQRLDPSIKARLGPL